MQHQEDVYFPEAVAVLERDRSFWNAAHRYKTLLSTGGFVSIEDSFVLERDVDESVTLPLFQAMSTAGLVDALAEGDRKVDVVLEQDVLPDHIGELQVEIVDALIVEHSEVLQEDVAEARGNVENGEEVFEMA